MILARRDFLNLLGVAAGAAGLGGCTSWQVPDRMVKRALRGPGLESAAQSVCGLCPAGCGMTVRLVDGLPVGVKGNPNHPLNRGGLCPVGNAALEVLYAPSRLKQPLRRVENGHQPLDWDEALELIRSRLAGLQASGKGGRLVLLNGESSLLFHQLVQRFAAALGSPNAARCEEADTLPYRLCQGADSVPGIDFSQSDLVLSFGLDLFEDGPAPVHAISALVGSRTTENRSAVLHVGTRLSPSASKAEHYVTVRPGTYAAFALGVAHVLVREGRYDRDFVANHTFGFEDWSEAGRPRAGFRRILLERYYPDRVAQICGCDSTAVAQVARRFAQASTPVALAGGEAGQADNGTWNVLAVHSLNALVGAFDRPGGVVRTPELPLTPLPPIETSPPAGESIFGNRNATVPRRDPVASLIQSVREGAEPIEVLILAGANPVYESALGEEFRQALEQIPLVVALAPFLDETASQAHLVLPTPVFLEGWHDATPPPTSAFASLGLGRPIVEPFYDSRHPGDVLLELSRRVGPPDLLPWDDYAGYLRHRLEGLAVSGQGAVISGSFEETWRHFLEERGWRFSAHSKPEEFWNELGREAGWSTPPPSPGDWERIFRTPSGRYEFFSQALQRELLQLAGGADDDEHESLKRAAGLLHLNAAPDEVCLPHYEPARETGEGELVLIPFRPLTSRGRLGAASPMVMEMFGYNVLSGWQTWAELAPQTADELGVEAGDEIALSSDRGEIEAVVRVQPGAAAGVVHVPIGLGREGAFGDSQGVGSNPLKVVLPVQDSLAGATSWNSTRVRLRLIRRRPHGGPAPGHQTGGDA